MDVLSPESSHGKRQYAKSASGNGNKRTRKPHQRNITKPKRFQTTSSDNSPKKKRKRSKEEGSLSQAMKRAEDKRKELRKRSQNSSKKTRDDEKHSSQESSSEDEEKTTSTDNSGESTSVSDEEESEVDERELGEQSQHPETPRTSQGSGRLLQQENVQNGREQQQDQEEENVPNRGGQGRHQEHRHTPQENREQQERMPEQRPIPQLNRLENPTIRDLYNIVYDVRISVLTLKRDLDEIKAHFLEHGDLPEKPPMLPFQTVEALQSLEFDSENYKHVVSYFKFLKGTTAKDGVHACLKESLKPEVAQKYTWYGKENAGTLPFFNTVLCRAIFGALSISQYYNRPTMEEFKAYVTRGLKSLKQGIINARGRNQGIAGNRRNFDAEAEAIYGQN